MRKHPLKSATVWVNAGLIAIGIYIGSKELVSVAGINIALRFKTREPIV